MSAKKLTDAGVTTALALSGGGFRASLFHLGALRRLNDAGLLSRMTTISSVSGGSITNGLLAARWTRLTADPKGRFTNFQDEIEGPMRAFCGRNLRNYPLITGRLDPRNWPALARDDYSVTNLLAERYDRDLLGGAAMETLRQLKQAGGPAFVFCATSLQTGVSFVFEPDRIGDYRIGYTWNGALKLGLAVAASSAFPFAFPPLALPLEGAEWDAGDLGDPDLKAQMRRRPLLSDGGVYDNMGLEPVWKSHDFVFSSDAGAPFSEEASPGGNPVSRLWRSQGIIDRQSRALRKRMLISAFTQGDYRGAYWGLTTDIGKYPLSPPAVGYGGPVLEAIAKVRTDLDEFHDHEQLVLMNHSWLLAGAALKAHCAEWPEISSSAPDEELLDSEQALAALLGKS